MKRFFQQVLAERATEKVESQEIDEQHVLSEQVFFRRRTAEWSQEELAEIAGMTQSQIAVLEAGEANPTLRSLVKVAHALGCRVGDLFAPPSYPTLACSRVPRWTAESFSQPAFQDLMLVFEREHRTEEHDEQLELEVPTRVTSRLGNNQKWLTGRHAVSFAIWETEDGIEVKAGSK
jgi:transcriptional regulator with XRE-family HTH domain